jgi:hypothetical protein
MNSDEHLARYIFFMFAEHRLMGAIAFSHVVVQLVSQRRPLEPSTRNIGMCNCGAI